MPDLVTHTLVPYFATKFFKRFTFLEVFLLGAIMPDIASRTINYTVGLWLPLAVHATKPMHAPLVVIAVCMLISFLFASHQRKGVFVFLLAGCGTHLIMDSFQKHFGMGYWWLFPLQKYPRTPELFWPNESLSLVPLFIIIYSIIVVRKSFIKR